MLGVTIDTYSKRCGTKRCVDRGLWAKVESIAAFSSHCHTEVAAADAGHEVDHLDVDVLATKVERASTLIQVCRDRIGAARVQVERVVASLESEDPDDEAKPDDDNALEV